MNFSGQPTGIRVKKFLIYETRGHAPQFRRAYKPQADNLVKQVLEERISKVDRITTGDMVGIAHQFLKPDDAPEDRLNPIEIVNGWEAPRCRWYLELEFDFGGLSSTITECFMGYTDLSANDGMSMQSNFIAPDMTFYMNSVSHLKQQRVNTLDGIQTHFNVTDTSQILANHQYGGARQNEQLFRMRPDDLFAAMTTTHLDFGKNHDGRNVMNQTAQKATRTSTIAPAFMAKVLDSYLVSSQKCGDFGNDEPVDILSDARGRAHQQSSAAQDPFMRAVSQIENSGTFSQDMFQYSTLCKIDPNADNIAEVFLVGDVEHQKDFVDGFDTANWNEGGLYSQFAAILSQAVPTLMMECGLRRIWFSSTNKKLDQQIHTGVLRIESFSNLFSLQKQGDEFVDRLNNEVLYDLSFNNTMDYQLEMRMTMHGEVEIMLALNDHEKPERFVAPLFADSLTTPIVTGNYNRLTGMAEAFGRLAGELAENNLLGSATGNRILVPGSSMAF